MRQLLLLLTTALAGCGAVSTFADAGADAAGDDDIDARPGLDAAVDASTGGCGADGTACTANGGTTCCGGACAHVATPGTCTSCAVPAHGPQRIAIIESVSAQTGHDMDVHWQAVATGAGHTATILPQTALDSLAGLADYDILVVSSGVIALPPARRAVVDGFAASRRGVYLQAEYQTTYTTNVALGEIVVAHGGQFTWTASVTGQQDPTTVNGCLATTPEAAPALTAYWYAATATASGPLLEVIHTAPGGQPIAWSFCLPGGGLVISNTDQDFIRTPAAGAYAHLRNVLVRLADAAACAGGAPPVE